MATMMFAITGCGTGSGVSISVPIDPTGWDTGSMRVVRFQNSDTLMLRDLKLFVIHDNKISDYTNELEFGVEMHTPGGKRFNENVKVEIDRSDEKNTMRESSRTYRTGVILSDTGEYRIILKNMSQHPLRGVRAVGIEITESENGKR